MKGFRPQVMEDLQLIKRYPENDARQLGRLIMYMDAVIHAAQTIRDRAAQRRRELMEGDGS